MNDDVNWSRVRVSGEDAESYLQGQLTQDLALTPSYSFLLNPDGTVIASLWIEKAADGYDLVMSRAFLEAVMARVNRFKLRSRLSITDIGESSGPFQSYEEQITLGVPLEKECASPLLPHAFSREFLQSAVSFSKGCYTGQELVGRLESRGGNTPWRMVRFRTTAVDELQASILSCGPEGPQGITTLSVSPSGSIGLAMIHRTYEVPLEMRSRTEIIETGGAPIR
jgi:folate-binding protein YgfZ